MKKLLRDPDNDNIKLFIKDKEKIDFEKLQKKVLENQKRMESVKKVFKKNKALFLAYDQGLEHGPEDFNDKNVNPKYIIDIAKKGRYSGLIFQKGIASKYLKEIKESNVPLIVKLNGKTNLVKGEPISRQICTVEEALNLGAVGVGYTIYLGSKHESKMLKEFANIQRKAKKKGILVIAWIYPRGSSINGKSKIKLMAYAARVGLEIGADIIKIRYEGKKKDLEWAVQNAGKTKVVIAGGVKKDEKKLIKQVREIISAGCAGLAIGRNVWQAKDPMEITKKLKKEVWSK